VCTGLGAWGTPPALPNTDYGAQCLRLGPRRKSQLAPGAEAKLQLALVRAGAVTPPALPAPFPSPGPAEGAGRTRGALL
jgi:hypothetical protein